MIIKLSPVRSDGPIEVSKSGDTLTINGQAFDFSQLPEGATLPVEAIISDHFAGPVERINGELHLTLRLPHGANPSRAVAFPEPIHITEDGLVALPFDPEQGANESLTKEQFDSLAILGAQTITTFRDQEFIE